MTITVDAEGAATGGEIIPSISIQVPLRRCNAVVERALQANMLLREDEAKESLERHFSTVRTLASVCSNLRRDSLSR